MDTKRRLQRLGIRAHNYLDNIVFNQWNEKEAILKPKGGFVENFSLDTAKPNINIDRRLRVQGRQVWSFSKAHTFGYGHHNLLPLAEHGWNTIKNQYQFRDGGFIHSVDSSGQPLNQHRFLYEQAFVLLAASGMYAATQKESYLDEARNLYLWISNHMKADEGFYTSIDNPKEARQQNPHMHLFEALMALFEENNDDYWLHEAGKIYHLFNHYFYDRKNKLLREFFTHDWKNYDPDKGDNIEPGHNYEWVWLLNHYSKLTGFYHEAQEDLYHFALKGTAQDGIGYDECSPDGTVTRYTARLWVQTEALKANLAQYELYGDDIYIERAEQIFNNIFRFYLRTDGLWGDQLDKNRQELSDVTPASTFYHLFLALSEVIRISEISTIKV